MAHGASGRMNDGIVESIHLSPSTEPPFLRVYYCSLSLPSLEPPSPPFLVPSLRELFTHPANLKTRSAEVDDRPIDGRDAVADCADVTGETFSPKSLTFDVLVFFHRVTFIPLPSLSLCHRDDSPMSLPSKTAPPLIPRHSLSVS